MLSSWNKVIIIIIIIIINSLLGVCTTLPFDVLSNDVEFDLPLLYQLRLTSLILQAIPFYQIISCFDQTYRTLYTRQ